jgi:hypothetical protein
VTWLGFTAVAAGACGFALSTQSLAAALAIPVAVLLVAILPLLDAGILVGLALILANNAIPGVDLTHLTISGAANGTDLAFLAIFGCAVVRRLSARNDATSDPVRRLATLAAFLFLGLWAVDFFRALDAGTHVLQALSGGRDFLYFGLTLPFASSLLVTDRHLRHCCIVVGVGAVLFAGADIAASLHLAPAAIANALFTAPSGSITRVYNSGYYLFELTFSAAFAYALLRQGRNARLAAVVATVMAVALILSFTRALYIGVILGSVLALIVSGIGTGGTRRILRHRVLLTLLGLVIVCLLVSAVSPSVVTNGPVHSVIVRASSAASALSSTSPSTSTVAYRNRVDSLMVQTLGTHWLFGLGFLSPQTSYYSALPQGSIRNNDVGVFNSLMTMGVVGTILVYLTPLWMLVVLIRQVLRRIERENVLRLAGMIWLFAILITSYSLGSFASVSGLATTVVGLGILFRAACVSPDALGDPQPRLRAPFCARGSGGPVGEVRQRTHLPQL